MLYVDITPKSPFYIAPFARAGTTRLISEIYSGTLRKNRVGKYEETVSINDGNLSDSKKINITVIKITKQERYRWGVVVLLLKYLIHQI